MADPRTQPISCGQTTSPAAFQSPRSMLLPLTPAATCAARSPELRPAFGTSSLGGSPIVRELRAVAIAERADDGAVRSGTTQAVQNDALQTGAAQVDAPQTDATQADTSRIDGC